MTKFRLAHFGLVMAAIGFTAAAPLAGFSSVAYAAEAVRAEIGKPLQEAQKLAAAGKNKEAVAKLKETDSVGNKSANETYLIERTRASAAASAGDYDTAARAFESVINSGKLSAAEQPKFTQALAGAYSPKGIRVNAICPGVVLTDRVKSRFTNGNQIRFGGIDNITERYPFGVGQPEDIANVALFLASDESRMVNGAAIPAEGGISAY